MPAGTGTAALVAALVSTMVAAPHTIEESNKAYEAHNKPVVTTVTITKKRTPTTSPPVVTLPPTTHNQGSLIQYEASTDSISVDLPPDSVNTVPGSIPGVSLELEQRFDQLSQCESGGDWHINTGNGFYGGLQFTPSTWDAFGGEQYAPDAHLATREQQIEIAAKVLEGQGWGAWPACTSKFGWR